MHIPSIDDVLKVLKSVEGGSIEITIDHLRPALEKAYDSFNAEWQQFVDIEESEENKEED